MRVRWKGSVVEEVIRRGKLRYVYESGSFLLWPFLGISIVFFLVNIIIQFYIVLLVQGKNEWIKYPQGSILIYIVNIRKSIREIYTIYLETLINRSYLPHLRKFFSYYLPSSFISSCASFPPLLVLLLAWIKYILTSTSDSPCLPASRFLGLRTLKQDAFISLTCTVMFCALSTSRTVLIWSRLIISTMPGWNSCVVTGSLSIRKHATLGISSHLPSCARLHVSVNALLLPRKTRNLGRMMLPKRAGGIDEDKACLWTLLL